MSPDNEHGNKVKKSKNPEVPIFFDINLCLTNCIYKCHHCYAESGLVTKKILSLADLRQIIEAYFLPLKIKGYNLHLSIDTQGLLYPEYPEWLSYLESVGMPQTHESGDGIPFNKMIVDRIETAQKHGLKSITFALFGINKTHDEFVGRKDSYKEILQFAKDWKGRLDYTWHIFLDKDNISQLIEIENLIQPLCKDENDIRYMVWRDKGRALNIKHLKLSINDLTQAGLEIDDPRFYMIFTEEKASRSPQYIQFYCDVNNKQIKLNMDSRQIFFEERNCMNGFIGNLHEIDWPTFAENIIRQRELQIKNQVDASRLVQFAKLNDDTVYNIYDIAEKWNSLYHSNHRSTAK